MYGTYLRRELAGRKRQTAIVAAGLAVAIALVIIATSLARGVSDAQEEALASVYGVGTDLTVTGAAAEPGEGGGQRFEFGGEQAGEDGTTELSQSTLSVERGRGTLDASASETAASTTGVEAVSAALALSNMEFSGEIPSQASESGEAAPPGEGEMQAPPSGGFDGAGGSAFDLNSLSVLGVDDAATTVGPLSSAEVVDGRALQASDAGALVAVVDETYATSNELAVGDTVELGGEDVEIVGVVASATDEADTAADVFIPLDVAQDLSGETDAISTVYVQATSSDAIAEVQDALEEELPDATVSSQSDLAATVSGSLTSASSLISGLGTWLSIIVLAVAVLLAVLFTISGVSRRTREFGTLKAIGWTNGRIVGQVAGESVVQGIIGGVAGVALGLVGVLVINLVHPTLSSSAGDAAASAPGGEGMGGGFGAAPAAETAADVVLSAPVSVGVILAAVGLAIAGGLVAGAIGGWRAARLSPAEALRSVA
ncbi:ABC transporter permease [Microbacterium sp. ZXX196]|uniref:ABC transporter permease n=1 Tax=Microbacterium sp. ZXX196 TaxID=2609291 RepID=UPI0012B6F933|nr:ABC transporter permease [Microbacterium sp. ZXX196]MTE22829.1 FtsX-like permease family protein [Microbacterium sp. ZXX196]